MVKISAFRALRPIKKLAQKVPTKTYLNYSEEAILEEKKSNPYSFLNIIHQPHIKHLDKRFKKIKEEIDNFKTKKILIQEPESCLYVYEQSKGKEKYIGLICTIDMQDYKNNKIKIHEKTIKKREILFTEYLQNTKIHAEPVLITYDSDVTYVHKNKLNQNHKLYNYRTQDNTQHTIWKINNQKEINNIITKFSHIENLYIADGHHRMASSSRLKNNHTCLAYIVPKNILNNYPFHRALRINKKNQNILKKIGDKKMIQKPESNTQNIQFYLHKTWYEISIKNERDTLQNLSVNKLLKNILTPIFSINNERESKNIKFIPGNQEVSNILNTISDTEVLFWMDRISIESIIQIANQNYTTPPKSTFILPKIPSGLIMMELS